MNSRAVRRWQWIALLAIALLAAALRFYRLDAQSLWNDEGTSVALAQRGLADIARDAAHDIHPPLYYYLLHGWIALFGNSEFAVRSLSALMGVLLVVTIWFLGRQLFGRLVGVLAAGLAAISPFQVYYAQEARMYILLALCGALSMLTFWRLAQTLGQTSLRKRAIIAVTYVAASVLAVYSHYLAFALLAAQNLAFLIWLLGASRDEAHERWRWLFLWIGLQIIILLSYAPWLALSWRSLQSWPAVSAPLTLGGLLSNAARVFAFGITVEQRLRYSVWGAIFAAMMLPAIVAAARKTGSASERWAVWLTGLYLFAPVIVLYVLSLQRPLYKPKFLILAAPAYYLLIARGLAALGMWVRRLTRRPWARWATMIVLLAALVAASAHSLANLYWDDRFHRDDYRGIAALIEASATPKDAILINAPAQIETFDYYYRGPLVEYPLPQERPLNRERTEQALQEIIADHPRIYAVFWATDESDPERLIESWLDQRCFKALDSWFGNVRLVVYAAPQREATAIAQPTDYQFGPSIFLRGYTLLTPDLRSGDIAQLTLFWETTAPVASRYKVFTHLVDGRGNIVGQRDSEPGGGARPTTSWQVGELIADNYGLPIQVGSPPGEHVLRIGLYDQDTGARLPITQHGQALGDALDLTRLVVGLASSPPPPSALDMQHQTRACWGGLCLFGYSLHQLGYEHLKDAELGPGQTARLTLYWRAEGSELTGDRFVVALTDRSGRPIWEQPIQLTGGLFPLAAWRVGEVVRDIQLLPLPADLRPGTYRLTLRAGDGSAARSIGRVVIK